LGQLDQAVTYGREALAISTKAGAKREMAYCHALLGTIAQYLHRLQRAQKATQKAIDLFREIGDRPWRVLMLNSLGQIAWLQQDLAQAETHFRQGLKMARDMGEVLGAIHNALGLSQIAQKQQMFDRAEDYAQQALVWAEKSGNARFKIMAAIELSQVYLAQQEIEETAVNQTAQLSEARRWLEHIQPAAEQCRLPLPVALWQIEMTRLLQAEKRPAQALTQIQSALKSMRQQDIATQGIATKTAYGIAWRELANTTTQMPPGSLPIFIDNRPYQVADCYQQSLQILTELKNSAKLEIAHTLFAWAVYEIRANHHHRGEALWHRALDTYTKLGLNDEIAKMERFVL
jgi:tetratricopeptide (TPR) repeat protein